MQNRFLENESRRVFRIATGGILTAVLMAAGGAAQAAVDDPDLVRVNSVVVAPAASVAEAEAAAKRAALGQVVKMRGNQQLDPKAVAEIMGRVDEMVETRHVLNAEPVGGQYQPAFYFDVRMGGLDEVVEVANIEGIAQYNDPRIQVAVVIRRLPKALEDPSDREAYIDDVNATVKEYYGRAGFSLVDFLNFEESELYELDSLRDLEKKAFNPDNPPTAIDYYLLGQLDIPNDAVSERDGGAYWRANAKMQIKLLDLNSGQTVTARRTVEGTGASARESVDEALRNVVKAIEGKASAPDILKTWKRNTRLGMKYEISVCDRNLQYQVFDDLLEEIKTHGMMSGEKSDRVPLYVFQFPGGQAIDPAAEFEYILKNYQERTGRHTDVSVKPIIYKKHKVFMFGNSPDCFGGARGSEAVQ